MKKRTILERNFVIKLNGLLKTEAGRDLPSMLIECKVVRKTSGFNINLLEPSQLAVFESILSYRRIVHKISDSGIGSKLIDVIFINPINMELVPIIALFFPNSRQTYLVPYVVIAGFGNKNVPEDEFREYEFVSDLRIKGRILAGHSESKPERKIGKIDYETLATSEKNRRRK